jgi:hypothetical protein
VIIQAIKRRKDNWIGHIVPKNWLLKHVTEGKKRG